MQTLAQNDKEAKKIIVIQDNLNTHQTSSFYEHLPADEAKALTDRFDFHYTPKSASWLNRIEIEFFALPKQCLSRRIGTKRRVEEQINAIVNERNKKRMTINWQFSIQTARTKLTNRYVTINPANQKFKLT